MIPNEDHHDPADRGELDATAYALGELAARDAETVAARLSADPQAKHVCAETKVIADDLRDAYEAAALPPASDALRASLDNYLTTANSEDRVVTKAPDNLPPARRRFTPLEILLSIAVVCFAAMFFLMSARGQVQTALVDTSASIANLDQSYSGGDRDETMLTVDDSESMSRVSPPRCVNICIAKNAQGPADESSVVSDKPLGLKFQLGRGEAPSTSDYTYDGYDGATPTGDPKPENKPVWATEYYRSGSQSGKHFPVARPQLRKLPYINRLTRTELPDVGGRTTVGLDPTAAPADDLDVDFQDEKLGPAMPAVGGFDPAVSGDQHARIYENEFKAVDQEPLSTFSIDVDTASYSKLRQHVLEYGQLPPPDAIRIEELINYFPYDYNEPMDEHPFAAHMEVAQCPWQAEHRLARIAIKGKEMKPDERPASNLVFLVDVSGSMNERISCRW